MPAPDQVVLKPRLLSSILFVLATSPLWGLGLYAMWINAMLGWGLIALTALAWVVIVGGVRIVAGSETVELRRLFWTEWKLPLDRLIVHRQFGGDLVPAYLLVDERGEYGTIVKPAFDPEALHGLMRLLHAHGAVLY
jgi:hypothetical protein